MKTLTLYRIHSFTDGNTLVPIGVYFENQKSAETWLKEHPYDCYYKVELNIYESTFDYNMSEKQRKKQEALGKLSPEEQQLLGLV